MPVELTNHVRAASHVTEVCGGAASDFHPAEHRAVHDDRLAEAAVSEEGVGQTVLGGVYNDGRAFSVGVAACGPVVGL